MHNIQWVAETISGTKKPDKRKLGSLLDGVEAGDTIICTELSRLGRSLMMILNVLQELLERLWTAQTRFETAYDVCSPPEFS
ncbi:MAG: recombinase family protein [Treponema sp.]